MLTILKQPVELGINELLLLLNGYAAEQKHILWLVSGGSNIDIACRIAKALPLEAKPYIMAALADERYGEPGHADSNYQKLADAGFTDSGIQLLPVLKAGASIDEAAAEYGRVLLESWEAADVVIAQLGIGADSHTSGVLPRTIGVESPQLVEHYQGPDFARITTTLTAVAKVDTAFVFSYGVDKAAALRNLVEHRADLAVEPCQILKQIRSVYLYNDQIEGEIT